MVSNQNMIEFDCDFLSSNSWPPRAMATPNNSTNTAPTFLTHSPPHLSTSAQQMLLIEQLEQLQHLAELAASESPPNTATNKPQLITLPQQHHILTTAQQQHQQNQPQLPTQLMVTDNSGDLIEQIFVDPIDTNLQLIQNKQTQQQAQLLLPAPQAPPQPLPPLPPPQPYENYHNTLLNKNSLYTDDIDLKNNSSFIDDQTITNNAAGMYLNFIQQPVSNNKSMLTIQQPHQHSHSLSTSPSNYVGYVRDHYDKSCSHCQNGSQPVVLNTNATFISMPGLAISACNNPYCMLDAHPHPQHNAIAYPYAAKQLLCRPSFSIFKPISEPTLPTINNIEATVVAAATATATTTVCNECVDQHFVDDRTGPQIDLGAVPTYHVHTPTLTAHKSAKFSLTEHAQLPTQSVLRLSRQLSEDALINAVPISEAKTQPASILKKPRNSNMVSADQCLDRRKVFKEGQSRSLDYDDLHAKSWGRRRIRYEDEIYMNSDYQNEEDYFRRYGSDTNIIDQPIDAYEEMDVDHYYHKYRANNNYAEQQSWSSGQRGYYRDSATGRHNMSLMLPRSNNQQIGYGSSVGALPYLKRRRNLPHIPNVINYNTRLRDNTHSPINYDIHERNGQLTKTNTLQAYSKRYRLYETDRPRHFEYDNNTNKYTNYDDVDYGVNVNLNENYVVGKQKGKEVTTEEEQRMQKLKTINCGSSNSPGSASGYNNNTTNITNTTVATGTTAGNIANNASSSFFANSHHVAANSTTTSPYKRASLKHTNTINDDVNNSNIFTDEQITNNNTNTTNTINKQITTTTLTTTTTTTNTTTKSPTQRQSSIMTNTTASTTNTNTTTTTTTATNTTSTTTTTTATTTNATATTNNTISTAATKTTNNIDENADIDANADGQLDAIDWDAIDAMLDDDFSDYDKDKYETSEEQKKDDANFSQSVDEKVGK